MVLYFVKHPITLVLKCILKIKFIIINSDFPAMTSTSHQMTISQQKNTDGAVYANTVCERNHSVVIVADPLIKSITPFSSKAPYDTHTSIHTSTYTPVEQLAEAS